MNGRSRVICDAEHEAPNPLHGALKVKLSVGSLGQIQLIRAVTKVSKSHAIWRPHRRWSAYLGKILGGLPEA